VALAIACLKAVLLVTMTLSDYYRRNWGHLVFPDQPTLGVFNPIVALAIACLKAVLLVTMMLSDYYWRNWGHW
jgi:hypothetical protein